MNIFEKMFGGPRNIREELALQPTDIIAKKLETFKDTVDEMNNL